MNNEKGTHTEQNPIGEIHHAPAKPKAVIIIPEEIRQDHNRSIKEKQLRRLIEQVRQMSPKEFRAKFPDSRKGGMFTVRKLREKVISDLKRMMEDL